MSTDIAGFDLRLRRRSIIGYALGMAAYAYFVVALYPTFKDDTSLNAFTEGDSKVAAVFGAVGSLTSPTGWISANLYANFLPLVVLLVTIGYGAHAIAGQDEAGQLSLVATLPVGRRSLLAQKLAVLTIIPLPIGVVTILLIVAGRFYDLSLDLGHLVGTTVGVILLGVVYGTLALLVGALTGSRGLALGITAAFAAAGYLVSSLAPVVAPVHRVRFWSPFYYAVGDNQLANGPGTGLLVLAGLAVALGLGAIVAFERLDIH